MLIKSSGSIDCNQISDKNKMGLGYNDVPPPLTGLFAPPSIDLSNSRLEKFVHPEFEGYGVKVNKDVSENVSKEVKKNSDAPVIEDWVSDCDEDETVVLKSLNVQKPKQADQPRKVSQNPRNNSTSWNTPMPKKLREAYKKPVLNNVKIGLVKEVIDTVLTKSGLVPFSTARENFSRTATPVSAARPFNTAVHKPFVNIAKPRRNAFQKSHSSLRIPFCQQTTFKNRNLSNKVNTVKANSINTAKGKRMTSAVGKQGINAVKPTAYWAWRPKIKMINHVYKNTGSCIYGSSRFHGDIQALLRRLDRQDLSQLYILVQERFKDHPLGGHDLDLWGDLRMIFDPNKEDDICELKCKALADLGASISLMPLSMWKKLGLPELISTRMTLELANRVICTPGGIARDVFVSVGKFTFPANFVIVDYESDPRVSLILGRPFLWTARAFIDVHGEEMILRDSDERLILNMIHDTSSYSNKPQKESINMIDIYNVSHEDYLEDLFLINHLKFEAYLASDSFPPGSDDTDFDPEGDLHLIEELLNNDPSSPLPLSHNPLSGSTTSSSPDYLLEEFADELALITFPPGNYDLPFDIESDLREIEYSLNHDPTKEMDSILEDSVDEGNLADPNNDLVDTIPEMFTDEHTLDYSSPPLYDDANDDLFDLKTDNDECGKILYDDPFYSKENKIKDFKLLIDELDSSGSSIFLP
ncbi:reverse transcriptase domain-containing protein [Tanacetum coccineum]